MLVGLLFFAGLQAATCGAGARSIGIKRSASSVTPLSSVRTAEAEASLAQQKVLLGPLHSCGYKMSGDKDSWFAPAESHYCNSIRPLSKLCISKVFASR